MRLAAPGGTVKQRFRREMAMLALAIVVALVGFVLKLAAAHAAGWFLVPLAAVACAYHIRVHALSQGTGEQFVRLAIISNACLAGALLLQLEFDPGFRCAEDTLSSVSWRLGWASEEGCISVTGLPAYLLDLAFYIPVAFTWWKMGQASAAAARVGGR
jgi:hypothetical protein